MEPRFKIVSYNLCPYVQRALIVIGEKGIEAERAYIDLKNKPAWFLKISPLGKVPVLEDRMNGAMFESLAICEYLDEVSAGSLQPRDPFERHVHKAWMSLATTLLSQITDLTWVPKQAEFDKTQHAIRQTLLILERQIKGPYFAGSDFHLVDATFAPAFRIYNLFDQIEDLQIPLPPRVQNWREALLARKAVADAVLPSFLEDLKESYIGRGGYLARSIKGIGRKKGLLWS